MVLDVLVQSRRDKQAAKRLLRKLLKRQCRAPRIMITDKLPSYGAAKREMMPGVEHRKHKGLNNRAENSHQPTQRRERQMKRFKSARHAQRFLSAHDQIANLFHLRRDHVTASDYRAARARVRSVGRYQQDCRRVLNSAPAPPPVSQIRQPWANNLTVPPDLRREELNVAPRRRRAGAGHGGRHSERAGQGWEDTVGEDQVIRHRGSPCHRRRCPGP
jgi:hypothetical protein